VLFSRKALVVLMAAALSGGCSASTLSFWASAGFWEPEVETLLDKGNSVARLDLQGDLGMTDDPGSVMAADFSITDSGNRARPAGRYNFSFWKFNLRNTQDVGAGFAFDNKSYLGTVKSRFTATDYVFTGEAPQRTQTNQYAGGIFGVHLLNVELTLQEIPTGDSSEMSKWIPMPVVGVRYEAKLGNQMSAYGLIEIMDLAIFDIESFDAAFYHIDAGLRLDMARNFSIAGGYKTWQFKVGLDEDYVKMDMDGATLTFQVRW